MKLFIRIFFLIFALQARAEVSTPAAGPAVRDHQARPHASDELNKESSSFVADPDSLDPLPVKKENLKEDEEPVLDDIRQVIDAPTKKNKAKIKKNTAAKNENSKTTNSRSSKNKTRLSKSKKRTKNLVAKNRSRQKGQANLQADDPDLTLEKNFFRTYKKYNAKPTSNDSWSSVLKGRTSESYKVQKGDTLWSISKTLFGDPNFWPKLWSLNKKGILNPHFISPGKKVIFYAGLGSEVPSLALTDEDNDSTDSELVRLSDSIQPGVIPDSLPLSRNDQYILPPQTLKVELQNQVEVPDNFTSDILLTDKEIVTEAEIPLDEIVKGRCGGDHVLKSKSIKGTEGVLKIFEALESIRTEAGEIFSYRAIGEAQIIGENKIRITSCSSVISESLFFVSPSQIGSWRSSKLSTKAVATIVGGPNLGTQSIFANHQLAYVDIGSQNVEIGQMMTIKSQLTEQTSGEIKVLDKFGSIAIGLVTEVADLIEKGDQVSLK